MRLSRVKRAFPTPRHRRGSATIRKPLELVNPSYRPGHSVLRRTPKKGGSHHRWVDGKRPPAAPWGAAGGVRSKKRGGRVPRQGRHVLEGTLDRMEGASLRGPETLPPWNLVFNRRVMPVGITLWSPEAFPPCTYDGGPSERGAQSLKCGIFSFYREQFLLQCKDPMNPHPKTTRRPSSRQGRVRRAWRASG